MINVASNTIILKQEEEIKIPPNVECIMIVVINKGCFESQDFISIHQQKIAN